MTLKRMKPTEALRTKCFQMWVQYFPYRYCPRIISIRYFQIGLTSIFYSKKFISIVTKPISMINTFISTNYTMINDEHEEDENEFNWWTKYYGFKHQKVVEFNKCMIYVQYYNRNYVICI